MKRALAIFVGLMVVVASGCGSDATFNAKYASDYARGGTVSLFGVFKDGRMNPELSAQLGPTILRKGKCDPAYSVDFVALKAPLATAVDDYVRHNGVTDTLLAEFGPSARGEAILVLSMSGHAVQRTGPTTTATTTRQQMPGSTRRGMPSPQYESSLARGDLGAFEMSASLYSVRLGRSVALLTMAYDGKDVDLAITKFGDRLVEEMPFSACSGWNVDVAIDEAKIKTLKEE